MKRRSFAILAVLLMLISVANAAPTSLSRPAATVNLIRNEAITMNELESEYQNYVAAGAQNITRTDVLETLINNTIFLQGAERDGITVSDRQVDQLYAQAKANAEQQAGRPIPEDEFNAEAIRQFGSVDAYKQALKEQTIVNQYLYQERADMLQNVPQPTAAQISSFYRQNQQAFFQAENVKLAHIYIPKTGDAAEDAASKRTLDDVAARIHNGSLTFERAVTQYSQDTGSSSVGGDIGWLTADNATAREGWGDEFCDEVLSIEPGEVSDVLESNTGYHIVRVAVHNDGKILRLTDPVSPEDTITVRDYIQQVLYMNNYQQTIASALQSMITELRAQAQINILYREQ